MTCIKTGAIVYFSNYGFASPADLYAVGDVIIIRWVAEGKHYCEATAYMHVVDLIAHDSAMWHREDLGVTVVRKDMITEPMEGVA